MLLPHHHNPSLLRPRRLVYGEPTPADLAEFINPKFESKVQEKYDQKAAELAQEIKKLEDGGKNEADIRYELKGRQQEISRQAFDGALRDLKVTYRENEQDVQVTYSKLAIHSNAAIVTRATSIYEKFQKAYLSDVDKAVDQYAKEKATTSGKTREALEAVPAATAPVDLEAANPETARVQEILNKHRGIQEKTRTDLAALREDQKEVYKGRTNYIDALTNPQGGMIDDYDDGFWGPENDYTSYTRARLNGYLYASDIFTGGSEAGKKAVEEAIKEPYELFSAWHGSRLDMKDLEGGMALKGDFDKVKPFTTFNEEGARFDRAIGTMAGLLRMTDNVIKDKKIHDAYYAYLLGEFAKINKDADLKNNEERQIEFLYKLQSFAEFINANTHWRADFAKVEQLTDPDRKGDDVINDYPDEGWFNIIGDDKNRVGNPVREGLNGYLYAVRLFHGSDETADNKVKDEYKRAFIMFEDVAGDMFEQEHLDRPSRGSDGDDDGFDLGRFVKDAEEYSTDPAVKYAIAGLLKFTEDVEPEEKRTKYRVYLDKKFQSLKPGDTREAQLTILSTVKSPDQAEQELKSAMRARLLQAIIDATKQHNQYKPNPGIVALLDLDPTIFSLQFFEAQAALIKADLDVFVFLRSQRALDDMKKKYDLLNSQNSKLKEPVYTQTELAELRKRIEENAKEFGKARAISKEASLDRAIELNFLKDLSSAEKEYFNIAAELDSRLSTINETAKDNLPEQAPPVIPGPDDKGKKTPGEGDDQVEEDEESYGDSIEANWASAELETPELGDYVGPLIADSFSDSEKTDLRNAKGKLIGQLENGEEVKRTAADARLKARNVEGINFIRIHWHGKVVWSPEEQLFKKDDFENPSTPVAPPEKTPAAPPSAPPSRPPEIVPGQPRHAASYLDQVFERVSREVESVPGGSVFDLSYDGQRVACRAEKLADGYHLKTSHPEAGNADQVFRTIPEMRQYIESGSLNAYLGMQTVMDRRNWDRFGHRDWLDRLKKINRTGPYSMFLEFDWKRNNAFETGNGKVDVHIGPDGRINYRIEKDYAGPDGQNYRSGTVGDFMQLVQALNHVKTWSESYLAYKNSESFPALQERERLLYSLMDAGTYDALANQIGQRYYFNHFDINGYAYMTLNWSAQNDLASLNRSLGNPILEVKLTPQNTIAWKLIRPSGPGNSWVGVSGSARDIAELGRQVESIRQNPTNALSTPAQNLPNLGYFGYALY